MVAWVRANRVGRAVMEASGGYERSWAEALRAAGVEVVIVDPKQIRHFAKAAGRLAKNDPIDAETIAWFGETFPEAAAQTHDPAREEVDRLVQARAALKEVKEVSVGDLLLEVNQPAQALIAYEQTLSTDPNRFRSVYGAAKAADRAGDSARAKAYYQQLAVLGSHADTEKPELAEAKAYLGQ